MTDFLNSSPRHSLTLPCCFLRRALVVAIVGIHLAGLSMVSVWAQLPVAPELTSHPDSLVYGFESPEARPQTFRSGDGVEIPIQREWVDAQKPGEFDDVPMGDRPYRVNQKAPRHVHTELREGRLPLYYFSDVRWIQEAGAKEEQRFLRRAYYTSVRVDLEKVVGARFMMKPFKPKWFAGHSAIYLEMAPGGFVSLDGEDSEGLAFSYEAHIRAGQGYSPIKGQFGAYPSVNVVGNWRDFLFRSLVLDYPLTLKQWKLQLSPEELKQLGMAIGRTVVDAKPEAKYNTFLKSCIHAAVDVINKAVEPSRRVRFGWGPIPNPEIMIPALVHRALLRKGLIDGDITLILTMQDGLDGNVVDAPPVDLQDPAATW